MECCHPNSQQPQYKQLKHVLISQYKLDALAQSEKPEMLNLFDDVNV